MRVRYSKGDLLLAGDFIGGLMPWEGGYEGALWVWGKSKLTQTWYWFRGNLAWVRTSTINLDPYWILDTQSSLICIFLPRTWLYPFQVSGVVEAKSDLLKSFLHANKPTWYWTILVGTYIYHTFWIFWIQIFLDPFPEIITAISYKNTSWTLDVLRLRKLLCMLLGHKGYFTFYWLNALLGIIMHGGSLRERSMEV